MRRLHDAPLAPWPGRSLDETGSRLGDLLAGYGREVDVEVIRGWWSKRCLTAIRWLVEHGFDPSAPGCEIDVLRTQFS